jgi:hypothetical protein
MIPEELDGHMLAVAVNSALSKSEVARSYMIAGRALADAGLDAELTIAEAVELVAYEVARRLDKAAARSRL